ncbi:uncharacterized protein N7443_007012 [Penicillium atrosanguineum]|uniref:uncharacterized protein n=1 Tax=Penicillium atrosanguineum TaxID=1132637 RepID=UPI00238786F1|nr:uncharacterized protein N7443_007012 [Penicillium atrosanguineum]KAJ5298892.1 hypothetical protein N7443_007012 [Penicillium atrosanguineum]
MIPPCDPSILENNPQFKRLYENLTTNLLNPDGSTRAHSADPTREAVAEDLKQCQIRSTKKRIKERTLKQLASAADSSLPNECHDNLAIITLYLETPRSAIDPESPQNTEEPTKDNAASLLAPDIEIFYSHIPSLILPFSNILSTAIHELRSLSTTNAEESPDTEPLQEKPQNISAHYRSTSNHYARARARDRRLSDRVQTLRRVQIADLPAARRKMAATAAELLAVQTQVLERVVVLLERVKYGVFARATKAKAEHLATVAQGVEGKLEVTKLEIAATLYTPETLAALSRYQQHIRESKNRLEERRELAMEELSRYGDVQASETTGLDRSGPGGTMSEIARRYGSLAKEVETVRMEIARLGE